MRGEFGAAALKFCQAPLERAHAGHRHQLLFGQRAHAGELFVEQLFLPVQRTDLAAIARDTRIIRAPCAAASFAAVTFECSIRDGAIVWRQRRPFRWLL